MGVYWSSAQPILGQTLLLIFSWNQPGKLIQLRKILIQQVKPCQIPDAIYISCGWLPTYKKYIFLDSQDNDIQYNIILLCQIKILQYNKILLISG